MREPCGGVELVALAKMSPTEAEGRRERKAFLQHQIPCLGKKELGRRKGPMCVLYRSMESFGNYLSTSVVFNHKAFTSLSLSSCNIAHLPLNFYTGLINLRNLCLDNNNIKELASEPLLNFSNLICLSICNNQVVSLPQTVLDLPCLCELYVEGNPMIGPKGTNSTEDKAQREVTPIGEFSVHRGESLLNSTAKQLFYLCLGEKKRKGREGSFYHVSSMDETYRKKIASVLPSDLQRLLLDNTNVSECYYCQGRGYGPGWDKEGTQVIMTTGGSMKSRSQDQQLHCTSTESSGPSQKSRTSERYMRPPLLVHPPCSTVRFAQICWKRLPIEFVFCSKHCANRQSIKWRMFDLAEKKRRQHRLHRFNQEAATFNALNGAVGSLGESTTRRLQLFSSSNTTENPNSSTFREVLL
eukprot:Nk52_evm13s256 gene=Nk52_evmTU13s256